MDILGNKPPEDEEIDMLVCIPVAGGTRPVYGSIRAVCHQCKTAVWVSVSGQNVLRDRKDLRPFCMSCAAKEMKNATEEVKAEIVPGGIEELRRHFMKIDEN
jgi:hypothetical protein